MAKKMYMGVDGVARNIKKQYVGVSGVSRKVKNGYIGVNGVARQFFSGKSTIGDMEVGASVFIEVNGTVQEFVVIQQGNPDSNIYDNTVDGTWLIKRYYGDDTTDYLYKKQQWDAFSGIGIYNPFPNSQIFSVLNEETEGVLSGFELEVKNIIKSVNLPYSKYDGSIAMGTDIKLFLLSVAELTGDSSYPKSGAQLKYFKNEIGDALNYYKYDKSATYFYWTRDVDADLDKVYICTGKTFPTYSPNGTMAYLRYAFILPSDTPINDDLTLAL